jgi:hypothetical protein
MIIGLECPGITNRLQLMACHSRGTQMIVRHDGAERRPPCKCGQLEAALLHKR